MALKRQEKVAIDRVSALIIANAMIFQEVLSQKDQRVRPLRSLTAERDLITALASHWNFILDKINYHPIFRTAANLLADLPADRSVNSAVHELLSASVRIVSWRAALRHDLAGRIFHRLLIDAKYLGAYYTKISAAALLLKLALQPDDYDCDWSRLPSVGKLRIADFACGTGTLLMAAADVVLDNYIRAAAARRRKPDLNGLHKIVLERVLYGFDVLQSAIHLTASTLMLRVPDDPINVTNLHILAFGAGSDALGSLEFLKDPSFEDIAYRTPRRVTGRGEQVPEVTRWAVPDLDLCVMNPPFTSSRRANLLFGSLPAAERTRMLRQLKTLVRDNDVPASVTAGLAAVFTAMADRYIKPAGQLALVLPRTVLSGISWEKTRGMLARKYAVRYIITCHEPGNWNFSENTSLSEVLLVARKAARGARGSRGRVVCVNLWKNCQTAAEALAIAKGLAEDPIPDVNAGPAIYEVAIGNKKFGEAVTVPWSDFRTDRWDKYFAYAQTGLVRALDGLEQGELRLPGSHTSHQIPLEPLGNLAIIGFDPRDVFDAFEIAHGRTEYPTLWGHRSEEIRTMRGEPNAYLRPLAEAREGRGLRDAEQLWTKAGRVLVAQRLRINTARLTAVRVPDPVLCNVWWSISLIPKLASDDREKALVLWLNSCLGTMILLGHREETEGSYIQFKKPTLAALPVLNVAALSRRQLRDLGQAYDRTCEHQLLPFSSLQQDHTRRLIDDLLADILGLPKYDALRAQFAREPLISARPLD